MLVVCCLNCLHCSWSSCFSALSLSFCSVFGAICACVGNFVYITTFIIVHMHYKCIEIARESILQKMLRNVVLWNFSFSSIFKWCAVHTIEYAVISVAYNSEILC